MSSPLYRAVAFAAVLMTAITGCQPGRPFYVGDRGDLQYYVDSQVDIRYADTEIGLLPEAADARTPLTLRDREITEFWDLTLEEVVNIAMKNTKTIRATGRPTQVGFQIQGTNTTLIDNPDAPTIYEVGIRETEPGSLLVPGQIPAAQLLATNSTLDTNIGTEAALAEFDTHVASNIFWNSTNRINNFQNVAFNPVIRRANDVNFEYTLSKKSATGTQFTLRNGVDFNANNNIITPPPFAGQRLPREYTARSEIEINQPLGRGRGTAVNRTPIIVARLGGDQTAANTEFFLQNMLTTIEIAYWDLYNSYRQFEVAKESVENAIKVYNIEKDNFEIGGSQRSTKATVSRSAEQYYNFVSNLNAAYAELQRRETDLRFLMGLSSSDGSFIRPIDEPTTGEVDFDWFQSINEALVLRPNLRIKQFEIKKKELGVNYAKNGLLPQINFIALYRFLGQGNNLFGNNAAFPAVGSGATNNMFANGTQEIQLGMQGGYTIGIRREMMNVRNAQLKLVRERARLEDMELDVVHELDNAFKGLALHFEQAKTNAHRWLASHEEVKTYADLRDQGIDITNVLDAQRNEAQARIAFHNSIAEYNKFLALVHRLKGTTLQYYNVQFGEGPWPQKAYYDAEELARKRSSSMPINYGFTRPGTVVVGTDPTDTGAGTAGAGTPGGGFVEDGMIMDEGDLVPLDNIEQIEPRNIDRLPTPGSNGGAGNGTGNSGGSGAGSGRPGGTPSVQPSPMGPTTRRPSAGSIIRASYMEADKEELKVEQIRWHKLGLDDQSQSRVSGTKATLRSID